MMDTDILDMLENIGRSSVARLSPAILLTGQTAPARRADILRVIRGTVLPRRLEFTASNGDRLSIEVNSSRVTDVFHVRSGAIPDFDTDERENLVGHLARIVSDMAMAPGPLEMKSLKPDAALEADDVGITLSEIETACTPIEVSDEPIISVVPDMEHPVEDENTAKATSLAQAFIHDAAPFSSGRALANLADGTPDQLEGACAAEGPLHPDQDLLARLAKDLNGWDKDSGARLGHPQLIVLRPSGGKGSALAILNDGMQMAIAAHEARKLGAVVNLWSSLKETEE